jgi:CheY-like chemotaxis protein
MPEGGPMTTRLGSLLIVDDEEMNRDMLSRRLELMGQRGFQRLLRHHAHRLPSSLGPRLSA